VLFSHVARHGVVAKTIPVVHHKSDSLCGVPVYSLRRANILQKIAPKFSAISDTVRTDFVFAETADCDLLVSTSRTLDGNHIGSVSEHLLKDMDTPAFVILLGQLCLQNVKVDNAGKTVIQSIITNIYMREVIPQNNSGIVRIT